jgi:small subunit ribosomal protein S7
MSRRRTAKKRIVSPDPVHESRLVHMLVNRLMHEGKKSIAYSVVYEALADINETTQQDPVKVLEQAVRNVTPVVEVKARRMGGSVYQVPTEVHPERGTVLALRWLLAAAKDRPNRTTAEKLKNELLDAAKNVGSAIRKRDEVHRMAEANKAFAKYRF